MHRNFPALRTALPSIDRFDKEVLQKVIDNSTDEPGTSCRVWQGCVQQRQYPVMHHKYCGTINVIPFVYRCFHDDTHSSKRQISHTCNNKRCVNPAHLVLRRYKENVEAFKNKWKNRQKAALKA